MFQFGNPNMFVMGTVDQTLYKRETGDVLGFDKLGQEAGASYNFQLAEVTGPLGSLVASIPNTTRLTGTYTSAAFSLEQRAALIGTEITNGAPVRFTEEITATGTTLTVTKPPVKFTAQPQSDTEGWCYVHEKSDATFTMENVGVDLTTKAVNFTATAGTTYVVTYFIENPSAQVVGMKSFADPSIVSILQRWNVFSTQNGTRENGTLVGHLHLVVPLAMLEGDAGIDGNQTTNSTTNYNWRAILPSDNLPQLDDISCQSDDQYLAYYVYVPCGGTNVAVQDIVVIGGNIQLGVDASAQIPVKYIMPGDKIAQPVYADLTFVSSDGTKATVGEHTGIVTGVAAGNAVITVTLTKEDETELTDTVNVTVTA